MLNSILLIEDNIDTASQVYEALDELEITIEHSSTGDEGLRLALTKYYSLLIVDVTLPRKNSFDICREIKQKRPRQSILLLSSKNSETDRVLGLELGADDYITKPFSTRELQARVKAHLRRINILAQPYNLSGHQRETINVGDLVINTKTYNVELNQKRLDLTAKEFKLLLFLAKHPDQVFTRTQLLESVWGYHYLSYEHSVNSLINRLRKKIRKNKRTAKLIETVWGVGYKFNSADFFH